MRLSPLFALLVLAGCTDVDLVPSWGSQYGHFRVRAYLDRPLDGKPSVKVGGVPAYDVEAHGGYVDFTVQGHPEAGPKPVEVTDKAGTQTTRTPLDYQAGPAALSRFAAFGASITQGTISAGVYQDSQLASPAQQIARQAGAFLPAPLIRRGLMEGLRFSDFDEHCNVKGSLDDLLFDRLMDEGIDKVSNKDGVIDLALARVDPEMVAMNVAVGGSTVQNVMHGEVGNPLMSVLEHVNWDLTQGLDEATTPSTVHQIDRLLELRPTVMVSPDLLDNDVIQGMNVFGDSFQDPDKNRPVAKILADLDELLTRLEPLGAQVFIGDVAPLDESVQFHDKVKRARAHKVSEATIAFYQQRSLAYVEALNAGLAAQAAKRPWVHPVGVNHAFRGIIYQGYYDVGPERLTANRFGGLLSLDDFHFTKTGYGLLASLFIQEMDAALDLHVQPVDLAATALTDPLTPRHLRAAGLTCIDQYGAP